MNIKCLIGGHFWWNVFDDGVMYSWARPPGRACRTCGRIYGPSDAWKDGKSARKREEREVADKEWRKKMLDKMSKP